MESKIKIEEEKPLNIIVTGCIHGALDKMYNDIQYYEKNNKIKIDLVLCTGDFESIRSKEDLNYLACPEKYREMGDFYKYFNGDFIAPYLTIFIGGNHEASNYLEENFYGGYVAENIFYLGRGGVINVKGIRIAGISGIFKNYDYFRGHFENTNEDINCNAKSVLHVREFEICKLSHIKNKVDIIMTHDWPNRIINFKDMPRIAKVNPGWAEEMKTNSLGSYPGQFLLECLKPDYFICGHMHYYYESKVGNTKVYALDKCLKRRNFFTLIQVKPTISGISRDDDKIYFDQEWCAINNAFNEYFPIDNMNYSFLELFEERNKTLYNNLVLQKIFSENRKLRRDTMFSVKLNENKDEKKKNIDDIICNLLMKEFSERKNYLKSIGNQTKHIFSVFKINEEDNKHYFSSLESKKENAKKFKADEKNKNVTNADEIDFDL